MSSATKKPNPAGTSTEEPDVFHVYCGTCDPEGNTALCGEDISGHEETDGDGEEVCTYCAYMTQFRCAGCGSE